MNVWLVGCNKTRLERWEKLLELVIPNIDSKTMNLSAAIDVYKQSKDEAELILLLLEPGDEARSIFQQWSTVKQPILFLISQEHINHEWKMKDSLGVLRIDTSISMLTHAMDLVMRGGIFVEPEIRHPLQIEKKSNLLL